MSSVNRTTRIVVDADACPVRQEIAAAGARFDADCLFVASYNQLFAPPEGTKLVHVDASEQSADLYIANRLSAGDILITQDFGLAAIGLAKGAAVLSYRGRRYTEETIEFLLEERHTSAKRRRSGLHSKGPKAFTQQDRENFLQSLTKLLSMLQENAVK